MTSEAETGVLGPGAKEWQQLPGARRGKELTLI